MTKCCSKTGRAWNRNALLTSCASRTDYFTAIKRIVCSMDRSTTLSRSLLNGVLHFGWFRSLISFSDILHGRYLAYSTFSQMSFHIMIRCQLRKILVKCTLSLIVTEFAVMMPTSLTSWKDYSWEKVSLNQQRMVTYIFNTSQRAPWCYQNGIKYIPNLLYLQFVVISGSCYVNFQP